MENKGLASGCTCSSSGPCEKHRGGVLSPWVCENLDEYIKMKINHSQATLKKFKERLNKKEKGASIGTGPHYAFEWGDGAIEAAANLYVFGEVKRVLTPPTKATHETLMVHVEKEVLSRAREVSRQGMRTAALLTQYERAAWADLLNFMRGGI